MREIRTYGSEGGVPSGIPTPIQAQRRCRRVWARGVVQGGTHTSLACSQTKKAHGAWPWAFFVSSLSLEACGLKLVLFRR